MHPILEAGLRVLAEACEIVSYPHDLPLKQESIRTLAAGCRGIVSQTMDPIGSVVLSLPGLQIVTNVGAHYANIDVEAATRHHVMVSNTPDDSTHAVADFVFGLMIAAARRILEADRFVRSGHFQGWRLDGFLGEDIYRSTLGLIGLGNVGRAIAERAGGFRMRILCHDPQCDGIADGTGGETAITMVALDELLADSDFVCVLATPRAETAHLISTSQLRRMKPTAILVNTSTGGVDEGALVDALRARHIAAAAIDVYEGEPRVHPGLMELSNVVLGAHCHSASRRLRAQRSLVAAQDVIAGMSGKRPQNLVNPDAFRCLRQPGEESE
ncbi:MAG TPA: NAD(P)-dependent oxidoreductase [bacterium]|nr:NAD(P)-dependent oxidoreductase [bacterium]